MKKLIFTSFTLIVLSCSTRDRTVQVGSDAFIYDDKVYRIIDNEITKLANLSEGSFSQASFLSPDLNEYGDIELTHLHDDLVSSLEAVHRGDVYYYRFKLTGIKLKDDYRRASLSINFLDEYGFQIQRQTIGLQDLVSVVDKDNEALYYEFNGQSKMSYEIYKAIQSYSVSGYISKTY